MCEHTLNFSGVIENVMETWPLQITVIGKTETLHFIVRENSEVMNKNQMLDPNQLKPGMSIKLRGMQTIDGQPQADLIEILSIEPQPEVEHNSVSIEEQADTSVSEEQLLSSPSKPMPPPQKP